MEGGDPFGHLIKFCNSTASQEAKFFKCPFARESENFWEANLELSACSSELTPSEPTRIKMISPPDTAENVIDQNIQQEEEPQFHTPPEEQNPDESSSDGARDIDDMCNERKRRNIGMSTDDQLISKKTKVVGEGLLSETMRVDETEKIMDEVDGNEVFKTDNDLIGLMNAEFRGELSIVYLDEDLRQMVHQNSLSGGKKVEEAVRVAEKSSQTLDACNENNEFIERSEYIGNAAAAECKSMHQNVSSCRTLGSRKAAAKILEGFGKDMCGGSQRRGVKNFGSGKTAVHGACSRRELPLSMTGTIEDVGRRTDVDVTAAGGKNAPLKKVMCKRRELPGSTKCNVGDVRGHTDVGLVVGGEKNTSLRNLLNSFNLVVGDARDGCEDTDFLEIAKKRGMTFPRPRWWPPEGDGL